MNTQISTALQQAREIHQLAIISHRSHPTRDTARSCAMASNNLANAYAATQRYPQLDNDRLLVNQANYMRGMAIGYALQANDDHVLQIACSRINHYA